MEKIGNKIQRLIREKGFKTIKSFYARLTELYGKNAIDRSTLTRLLKNRVIVRERTLNQIAIILGVGTASLREGTDVEVSDTGETERFFTYNPHASLKVLDKNLPFAAQQLSLKAGGRTAEEQDAPHVKDSLKWVFVLVGKVRVIVHDSTGEKRIALHKSQHTSFDARGKHIIENASRSTSVCLIIHYPAKNSVFYSAEK